jgi:hypothetical protein
MQNGLPEDVKDGIELIKKTEFQSNNHDLCITCFIDGVDLLHDYLNDESESAHKEFIKNTISAYTRILLKRLPKLEIDYFHMWSDYMVLLFKVKDYLDDIFSENPHLKENYDTFRNDPFRDEFLEWLKT